MTIRVLTWNIWGRHGDHERRAPAILDVIRSVDPDVVMLQESWADEGGECQPESFAAALGYHVAWAERPWFSGKWLGNAVLSRWPLANREVHDLPHITGRSPYRHATVAHVDTPWGVWPFISTHFEHRFDDSEHRQLHARSLLEVVKAVRGDGEGKDRLPVVVGGDLNAVPDSDEIAMLTGRRPAVPGVIMSDVWEHVGPGGRLGSEGLTWRSDNPNTADSTWPNRRLDYVLVSWPRKKPVGNPIRSWLAGTEAVLGVHPSDHAAVVVDLVTPGD